MKKVLTLLLIITLCLPAVFFGAEKSAHAETKITPIPFDLGSNFYNSSDVSYMGNNIIFLVKLASTPQIVNLEGPSSINLSNGDYIHLCGYNNEYFYATSTDVYCYSESTNEPIGRFKSITDLVVSSKSLFLIDYDETKNESSIFKYNPENLSFDSNPYKTYTGKIKKFAYSEVSKKYFAYNGAQIIIESENNLDIQNEVTEMLCDFEGNLFVFESLGTIDKISRYSYETNYNASSKDSYTLDFGNDTHEFISAAFNQSTGEFALLRSYKTNVGDIITNIYKISRNNPTEPNSLQAKTSNDIPTIPGFEGLELSELNELDKSNFYAAVIIGYPSNRLYPADVITNGTAIDGGGPELIEEIEINEKVLVFETVGKFSYILYKDKFAVVYNNSLVKVSENKPPEFEAKVLLNRSKIFSCPSNFVYKQDLRHSFFKDEIAKDEIVKVVSEIEFYGTTYCEINYGNNFEKTGYINKAEISEQFGIQFFDPKPGRIDSNKDIPLYKDSNILSEQLFILSHKQNIQILESGSKFCYISVIIDDKVEMGYVETQFVLEEGLTRLQKIGLWIFITAVLLTVIAVVLRVVIVRRKRK